ncbi:MAG: hypothetical protein CML17_00605 [Pusillimonas sp.]|nr:hypothetical protein [Pusillimonas sp.]
MNYKEYFIKCREEYSQENKPTLDEFYNNPVITIPQRIFDQKYYEVIETLSSKVKLSFDNQPQQGLMLKSQNIWEYKDLLTSVANYLVPFLEQERYGCHLYVDKVYIYRTLKINKRESSYLWHYDNNPKEIVKNIVYLNDVTEDNSPFEYLGRNKIGIAMEPSRKGPTQWNSAPNNSRIDKKQLYELHKKGYSGVKVIGQKGKVVSFNNDCIHRANPIKMGYRDVLNMRVKPTLKKPPEYLSKSFTTGFEHSGVVNKNPELAWSRLV